MFDPIPLEKIPLRPLDIVKDKTGAVGIVQQVSINTGQHEAHQLSASVVWLDTTVLKNAWWKMDELTVIGSIPNVLTKMACGNYMDGNEDLFFPLRGRIQ